MLVLTLVALNIAASVLLPRIPVSGSSGRNPFRFRGFPEYLSGIDQDPKAEKLVLLSNSQAYAGEYPPHEGYPAQLQNLLNETDAGRILEVHNWSVDGITSMEYMLLAARLLESSPAVLVASIGYADFKGRNADEGFSHCRSDLPRLVSSPRLAQRLPGEFWQRHGRVEDTLGAVAGDLLPALRFPEFAWSWLDQRYPSMQPLLYAPSLYFHPWELNLERKWKKVRIARPPAEENDAAYYEYDDRSTEMLEEFLAMLAAFDVAQRLVVACPGNHPPSSSHASRVRRFRENAMRLTDQYDLPYVDLTEALPREDFLDSFHFNRENHRRYAERLWSELTPDSSI